MIIFTSIAANYLPKARVLARTVKQHCPDTKFVVVLCDKVASMPQDLFDEVITADELDIPVANRAAWFFTHSVVELCTAVKGVAFQRLFEQYPFEKVMYLDPDVVVLDSLAPLEKLLDNHSVLVTPHLTEPYPLNGPLMDLEVERMQFGIYNFGFLAIKNDEEGRRFLTWWSERLIHYCFVDLPRGIFTDQRWGDLIPVFFPDTYIVRDKSYNVATWNLKQRKVECDSLGKLFVEGKPIRFYHFSGFDSGLFNQAIGIYGDNNEGLNRLTSWYRAELEAEGQAEWGKHPCYYARFENQTPITLAHRLYYRQHAYLADVFPNPYLTQPAPQSFYHFCEKSRRIPAPA